jgi:hypothetical protein
MCIGLLAGIVDLVILSGLVYYVQIQLGMLLFPMTCQNIAMVCGIVIGSGLIITLFASLIATGKYIRMDNNSLYEI